MSRLYELGLEYEETSRRLLEIEPSIVTNQGVSYTNDEWEEVQAINKRLNELYYQMKDEEQ